MTTSDLARLALPHARAAAAAAKPDAREAVGRLGWLALWPAWAVFTGPLLPLVVRVAVEMAVGLLAPQLLPVLELVEYFIDKFAARYVSAEGRQLLADVRGVLATPRGQFAGPSLAALEGAPLSRDDRPGVFTDDFYRLLFRPAPQPPSQGADMASEQFVKQIENDVSTELSLRSGQSPDPSSGRSAFPSISGAALSVLVPQAVQSTIDLLIRVGGDTVRDMVAAEQPVVRQFISQNAVLYAESILKSLEDLNAAPR